MLIAPSVDCAHRPGAARESSATHVASKRSEIEERNLDMRSPQQQNEKPRRGTGVGARKRRGRDWRCSGVQSNYTFWAIVYDMVCSVKTIFLDALPITYGVSWL